MNIILVEKKDYIGLELVSIKGRRFTHINKVLSPKLGNKLKCGELGGLMGTGKVVSINEDHIELNVSLTETPPEKIPVTVIVALPRPKVLKRLLQNITSMGVKRIFLINAKRVEKSYWQSPVLSEASIKKQLTLGLEQAKDTILPEVKLCKSFKKLVEDEMPEIIKGTTPILAHPGGNGTLGISEISAGEPFTIAVGPEGGFIPYELEKLLTTGFNQVSLGPRILKTETATITLIGGSSLHFPFYGKSLTN